MSAPQEMEDRAADEDLVLECICDFEEGACGGLTVVYCSGCGGDQCVCPCGGESECFGCSDCEPEDYD